MFCGPHKSKWDKFDQIGELEVLEVLGLLEKNPKGGGKLYCRQWFYRIECSCGNIETRSQKNLKRSKVCTRCAKSRAHLHKTEKREESQITQVEGFASMRWGDVYPMPVYRKVLAHTD